MTTNHTLKLRVGETRVSVQNDQFAQGMQAGYMLFLTEQQGKPLSDAQIYELIAQSIYHVRTTTTYNAGFVVGWIKGLLETKPTTARSQVSTLSREALQEA